MRSPPTPILPRRAQPQQPRLNPFPRACLLSAPDPPWDPQCRGAPCDKPPTASRLHRFWPLLQPLRLMIDGRLRVVGRAGGFGEEDEEVLESFLGIVATIVKSSFVFESLGKDVVSEAAAVFSQGPAHLQRRPSVSRYVHTPTPSDR